MKKCRLCGQQVPEGRSHRCPRRDNQLITSNDGDDDGSFLISMAIAAATDSAIAGGLLGGDLTGGLVGDLLDGDLFD